MATAAPPVFCGFGGGDFIDTLDAGDISLGGSRDDSVGFNSGTFYGQDGVDLVRFNLFGGTFYGGADSDIVINDGYGGIFVD